MSLKHDSLRKLRKEKHKWKISSPDDYENREKKFIQEQLIYAEPTIKGQVRITAGKVKNIKIDIPRKTRPLTDRIKTRIFDILREDIANKSILDMYAGSGSFGLEALSRGAKKATFVDASKQAESILLDNVKRTGFLTETNIEREKAVEYLNRAISEDKEFEIIFVDPPYKNFNRKNTFKMNEMLNLVKQLLPGYKDFKTKSFKGVLILKHPRKYPLEKLTLDGIKLFETYLFGLNAVSMYIVEKKSS